MILCAIGASALIALRQDAQPTTYVSRSGELELFVDPRHRWSGPAKYELRRMNGVQFWARELPITFEAAVVMNDGTVAAYGYDGATSAGENGPLHVIVVDASGEVRWDDELPLETNTWHGDSGPNVCGMTCDEARDRLVLVLRVSDAEREWSVYRLSDGERVFQDPRLHLPKTPNGARWEIAGARSIPGTPLDLVAYLHDEPVEKNRNRTATIHALVDAEGRPVWTLERPNEVEDEWGFGVLPWGKTILDAGERTFALWHVGSAERVDYRVERGTADGEWVTVETSRAPHDPVRPAERAAKLVPEIELPRLATTRLGGRSGGGHPSTTLEPSAVDVSPDGRIFVHDALTGTVHAFDALGERVLRFHTSAAGIDPATQPTATRVEGDGYIQITYSRDASPVEHCFAFGAGGDIYFAWNDERLRFTADGAGAGVTQLGGEQVVFVPGTDRRWITPEFCGITLLDADGSAVVSHERRPGDRRWLRVPSEHGLAVASDGSAAVLTECEYRWWLASPALAIYSADGEPLRTVPLPVDVGSRLDFDGRRAVVVARDPLLFDTGEFGPKVHLLDLAADSVQRFAPRLGTEHSTWDAFLAPSGRELWLVDSSDIALHRFALPE